MGIAEAANRIEDEAAFAMGGYPALIKCRAARIYNSITACCH